MLFCQMNFINNKVLFVEPFICLAAPLKRLINSYSVTLFLLPNEVIRFPTPSLSVVCVETPFPRSITKLNPVIDNAKLLFKRYVW